MPSFLQYGSCTIEGDLADTNLALRQTLTDSVLAVESLARTIASENSTLSALFTTPTTQAVETMLGMPVAQAMASVCTPPATTVPAVEDALRDRDGMDVVGGRALLPGPLDLTCMRTLQRLLGSFEQAQMRLSSIAAGNFLWVVTTTQTITSGTTVCAPEPTSTETEIVVGINVSFAEIARTRHLPVSELRGYLFWRQYINPSEANYARMIALGVPPLEMGPALTGQDGTVTRTCLLQDPADYETLTTRYGITLADQIVASGPATVEPFPRPEEVLSFLRGKALARSLGSVNPCGSFDATDPASNILVAVDVPASVGLPEALQDCLASGEETPPIASILSVLEAVQGYLQTGLTAVRTVQLGFNQTGAVLMLVQSLLDTSQADLLACLTRSFPNVAVQAALPRMRQILAAMRAGATQFDKVLGLFQRAYGLYATVLCTLSALFSGLSGRADITLQPRLPGPLACAPVTLPSLGLPIPDCVRNVLDLALQQVETMSSIFGRLRQNLQTLRQTYQEVLEFLETNFASEASLQQSIDAALRNTPQVPGLRDLVTSTYDPTSAVCNPAEGAAFVLSIRAALARALNTPEILTG